MVITRPAPGPQAPETADPVARWRLAWQQSVAEAQDAALGSGSGDAFLAARRRDYGTYLFVAVDLIVVLILGQVIYGIPLFAILGVVFVASGHTLTTAAGWQEFSQWLQAPPPLALLPELLVPGAAMLTVLWYRARRQRLSWTIFGWSMRQLRTRAGRAVLLGLGIGVLSIVLSSLVADALLPLYQKLHLDPNEQAKIITDPLKHAPLALVLAVVFVGTFVAPVIEELFFRGYVFRAVAVRKGVPIGYAVSALAFAGSHLLLTVIPSLFVVGLLLCFAYRRSGNLLANITAHAFNNGFAFAVALLALPLHL